MFSWIFFIWECLHFPFIAKWLSSMQKISCHFQVISLLYAEKSALFSLPSSHLHTLRGQVSSSYGFFQDFSLVWLSGVMKIYLGTDCFRFILFGIHTASWICRIISLVKLEQFSTTVSSRGLSAVPIWDFVHPVVSNLEDTAHWVCTKGDSEISAWLHRGEFSMVLIDEIVFYLTLVFS